MYKMLIIIHAREAKSQKSLLSWPIFAFNSIEKWSNCRAFEIMRFKYALKYIMTCSHFTHVLQLSIFYRGTFRQ